MIIPMRCMTCRRPISHLWISYVETRDKFYHLRNDNPDQFHEMYGDQTPEYLSMRELKIIGHETGIPWNPVSKRYCCSRHFLGCPEGLANVIT